MDMKELERIKQHSSYFSYLHPESCQAACKSKLSAQAVKDFKEKIDDEYRVNMILDNLPVAVLRQRRDGSSLITYEHGFRVGFKGNYAGSKEEVDKDKEIVFSYDVSYKESETKWASRWDTYLMNDDQIHWFSIINSLMIVLILSGMVAMIMMRTLYKDITNYNQLETQNEAQEETGWKLVHGDVFRAPINYGFKAKKVNSSEWEQIIIPSSVRSIVALNLPSYGSGRNPWGNLKPDYQEKRGFVEAHADDGLLEVFGFKQGWHASMVMVELISAKHITQASAIRFELRGEEWTEGYMQMDGEPWKQPMKTLS
ncbi:hypothetical protein ACS0TY_017572 [Phlomoides rotata]